MYTSKFYIITSIVISLLFVRSIAVAETKCNTSIVVRDSSGDQGFGMLYKTYPDGPPLQITPQAIAIDSKNHIYVADSVNYRVLKFDTSGNYILEIKLQPSAHSMQRETGPIIKALGTDNSDNVYVWNLFEERVEIYDPNGIHVENANLGADKLKGMFANTLKGTFSKYKYDINSYNPDKKYPGRILYSITVSEVTREGRKVIATCNGVELDHNEDGLIYAYDYNGNIYTFDSKLNVVKINPFK